MRKGPKVLVCCPGCGSSGTTYEYSSDSGIYFQAASSGMDCAVMSGGDVGPLGKDAVTELHGLFRWAAKSARFVPILEKCEGCSYIYIILPSWGFGFPPPLSRERNPSSLKPIRGYFPAPFGLISHLRSIPASFGWIDQWTLSRMAIASF